jgi:hypothetical protein
LFAISVYSDPYYDYPLYFTQERYESSFLIVSGDLKKPISQKNIPLFSENLFPSFPYRISSYNVKEVLDVFGRSGRKSQHIFWPDFRKILRERKNGILTFGRDSIFIKTTFNPDSWAMKTWHKIVKLVAVYFFIVIPVRIAFDPWGNMLDLRALSTDLVVDGISFLNLIIVMNTCYTNSRAAVVTDRMKILRRVDYNILISVFPLDW